MNEIRFLENRANPTVKICGRVDSKNAADVEEQITACLQGVTDPAVVLDAEDLEYISSAGLRVLLRLRKAHPEVRMENVSTEVYEILEMTGFTEILPIVKAYRKLSVEGCEVIGEGANGSVYRLDPDTIVKVYTDPDALPDINKERELARTAFILGIPTAIPYDVVRVGDLYGTVFELLNAKSFAELLMHDRENADHYITQLADLLKLIHSTKVKPGSMPDMKETVLGWVDFLKDYLEEPVWKKLRALTEAVPAQDTMLHGDFHAKNVMMQNGEVLLIDMDTLCEGHPIFELAAVFNAYIGFNSADHSVAKSFLGLEWDDSVLFFNKFMHKYLEGRSEEEIQEIIKKASIVGFTRILRRTIKRYGYEDGKPLIDKARECLDKNIPEVDSLYF